MVRGQQSYSYRLPQAGGFSPDVGPSGQCPPAMSSRACLPDSPNTFRTATLRYTRTHADPPLTSLPGSAPGASAAINGGAPAVPRPRATHPVRIFSSLLPVPNKEQQRKVSQLARTLLLLSRWIVISFVVLLPRFVRAFVRVRGFVICAHAWGDASNLGSSSVEGVTDAHLFFCCGWI